MLLLNFAYYILFKVILLLIPSTLSQQVASSPGLLEFPSLPSQPGVLRHTVTDTQGNIYAGGTTPAAAFVIKRSPSLDSLWLTDIPSLPSISPTISFSNQNELFAIAPRYSPDNPIPSSDDRETISFVNIILYQLDTANGKILRWAEVERVRLVSSSTVRCVLASATAEKTLVYITYVVQDGIEPSTARTRVVQMVKWTSGEINVGWRQAVTASGRRTSSAAIAADFSSGRVFVVEASAPIMGKTVNKVSLYSIDEKGEVIKSASMAAESDLATIEAFGVDDNGSFYIAEGPDLMYRAALKELGEEDLLVKVWNVMDIEVVDITVLKNGTAIYILSNGDGFRHVGSAVVRTKTPILSVYNLTGHRLFQKKYVEPVPDAERKMYSLSLIDPSTHSHAILGGYFELSWQTSNLSEKQVSLGLFTFPQLLRVNKSDQNSSQTAVPVDPNSPGRNEQRSNTMVVIVGVGVGVAVVLVMIGAALLVLYRSKATEAADATVQGEVDSDQERSIETIQPIEDHTILV